MHDGCVPLALHTCLRTHKNNASTANFKNKNISRAVLPLERSRPRRQRQVLRLVPAAIESGASSHALCAAHAGARLLSMAAMMWMTMGSASVGRAGTCTDMTVNTLYLQGGADGGAAE